MKQKLFLILAFSASVSACTENQTLGNLLNKQGYLELIPATNQFRPPSFNAVDKKTDSLVNLIRVCSPKDEDLASFQMPVAVSSDQSSDLVRSLTGDQSLAISQGTKALVEEKIGLSVIKSVSVKLTNVRVISSSIDQIVSYEETYKETCGPAIKRTLYVQGMPVCHTLSVLQADAVYTVDYKTDLSGDVKASLNKDVAAALGAKFDNKENSAITSKDLDIGVKLERKCLFADKPGAEPYYLQLTNLSY